MFYVYVLLLCMFVLWPLTLTVYGQCLVGRMAMFARLYVECLCCFVVYVRSVASHLTRCGRCLVGRMAMVKSCDQSFWLQLASEAR